MWEITSLNSIGILASFLNMRIFFYHNWLFPLIIQFLIKKIRNKNEVQR